MFSTSFFKRFVAGGAIIASAACAGLGHTCMQAVFKNLRRAVTFIPLSATKREAAREETERIIRHKEVSTRTCFNDKGQGLREQVRRRLRRKRRFDSRQVRSQLSRCTSNYSSSAYLFDSNFTFLSVSPCSQIAMKSCFQLA